MADPACRACGAGTSSTPSFRETCPACGAWLHVCLNCRHHDPNAHHHCRASATTEFVADTEKFNYCEEFAWGAAGAAPKTLSRADADKLFEGLS